MSTILLTGIAGFIGSYTGKALVEKGHRVIGIDNFNDYYDVNLKRERVKVFGKNIEIHECDLGRH